MKKNPVSLQARKREMEKPEILKDLQTYQLNTTYLDPNTK